jgi:hypothetical protein
MILTVADHPMLEILDVALDIHVLEIVAPRVPEPLFLLTSYQ